MVKLQVLPEPQLSLQVMGQITKAGEPVILPVHIAQNGTYYAGADKASGYNPVTVDVDMTPAKEEGYLNGYEIGAKEGAEVGYKKGEAEGYEKGVAEGKVEGYEQGYGAGYEKGSGATRYMKNIEGTFKNVAFPVGFELDLTVADASGSVNGVMSFANGATGLKSIKLSFVNKGTAVHANYAFAGIAFAEDTLEVVDISGMGCSFISFVGTFQNRKALKKIVGEIDLTGCVNCTTPFPNSTALEEIAFKQGTIPKSIQFNNQPNLTDASIQSIVDGLADLTGATAQTLTFHRTVGNKLTKAQKDAISAKNWTLAY